MDFKFTAVGKEAYDKFQKAIVKMEKEYVRQVGASMKPVLKEAVVEGKSRIAALFGGRGKRFQRALTQGVKFLPENLDARMGYSRRRGKNQWWWLGRIWEKGATITSKKGKGLWVPIAGNRAADGRPVITAKQYFSDFKGRGVVKMSSRGNLIAFGSDGDELVPMFVIKQSLDVKPRPVVTPTAEKFLPRIRDAAAVAIFDNFRK